MQTSKTVHSYLTDRLPIEIIGIINQYAANPQPFELCRDIKSYTETFDLMREYFIYLELEGGDRIREEWRLKIVPALRQAHVRVTDLPLLVNGLKEYTNGDIAYALRYDHDCFLRHYHCVISAYDYTYRCPYAKAVKWNTRLTDASYRLSRRRLKLYIGLMTWRERKAFEAQYDLMKR